MQKNCFGFSDLDPIFVVIGEKNVEKCLVCTLSPEGWMDFNQTCLDISLGVGQELIKFLLFLTSFSRSQAVKEC